MLLIGFIVAQIIIFAIIIFVLKKLIFQDTNSAINRLTKLDDLNREKEKQLALKLEETEKLLKQKKDELVEEEKRMKMESERAATQLHDDIVFKAKKEAEEVVKKALAAREKMKTDAMIEAEEKTLDLCRDILAKVISPTLDDGMNESFIRDFLKELENTDMSVVSKTINKAELISAKNLNEEIVKKAKEVISTKLERPVEIVVKLDVNLIAGVIMKFGTLVIDDSLTEHLKDAVAELKNGLSSKYKAI